MKRLVAPLLLVAGVALILWGQGSSFPPSGTSYTAGSGIAITGGAISTDSTLVPQYSVGAGVPSASCTQGRDFYTNSSGGAFYNCTATDTWGQVGGSSGLQPVWLSTGTRNGSSTFGFWQVSGATQTTFGTTPVISVALSFADAVDTDTAVNSQRLVFPSGAASVDLKVYWHVASAATGDVVWQGEIACTGAGDSATGPTFNTADSAAGTTGGNAIRNVTSITTVPITNCAAGEEMWVRIIRLGANGSDTLSGSAAALMTGVQVVFN